MKKIMIIGLIYLIFVGGALCRTSSNSGNLTYPNVAWISISDVTTAYGGYATGEYLTLGNTVRLNGYRIGLGTGAATGAPSVELKNQGTSYRWYQIGGTYYDINNSIYASYSIRLRQAGGTVENPISTIMYIYPTSIISTTISGAIGCVNVELQSKNAVGNYETLFIDDDGGDEYSFTTIEGLDYKLKFSDGIEYIFTCTGDEVYDYNACSYTVLHLKDYCGYTMWGACSDIYMSDAGEPSSYEHVDYFQWRYEINLTNMDVPLGKMLDIYFDTDMGTHHEILYADGEEHDILHPSKSWRMTFTVKDEDTLIPIEGARIIAEQTCTINPEHPLRSYLLTDENGQGTFIGLSGGFFNFSIWATGYKIDRAWYEGYGHSAFVTDLYDNAFLNSSSNETTEPRNETGNQTEGCYTYFTNENGITTNRINDTDSLVYLNYSNSNCSSTLKFQRLYGSYWMTKASYNIPALQNGSKTIPNGNFSDYDACYRAYMYSYECDCNNTHPLYVLNKTVQEEQHYENLSAYCKFKYQMGGGQVDYRDPIEILTYAYSNTSATLLNINLTLYDSSGVIATKQCDWTDFASASPKWYYVWEPSVNYDIGENYTIVMTGYNGHTLSADEVWTSNIRNNKLTVNVRDNHNTPIAYSTVFVQNWGSQALDSDTSFIVSGLQDQVYQYKATKSGYTSSGWASVNLSGADQTVTCILIEQETSSITGYKLKDGEIKAFFIPLMYLLMVMILIGGLMNAAKR